MTAVASRWIQIGTLYRRPWRTAGGNLGSRRCAWGLVWRGRVDWCQPDQFDSDDHLRSVVGRRLALAGLALVDWRLDPAVEDGTYQPLRCQVTRLQGNKNS